MNYSADNSCINLGCLTSGPGDLCKFKSCMRRLTISTVVLIFDCLGACLCVNLGI